MRKRLTVSPLDLWWSMLGLLILCSLLGCTGSRPAHVADRRETLWPGRQADGSMLLPNQWSLRPIGKQVELGDFPVNIALHPRGHIAAVLHAGQSAHEILLISIPGGERLFRFPLRETFYGIEFSADGRFLFCSGAGDEVIHRFELANNELRGHAQVRLRETGAKGVPSGIAVDTSGETLFAANLLSHSLSRVELSSGDPKSIEIPFAAINLANTNLVVPSVDPDAAAAEKRDEANRLATSFGDPYPYACKLDPSGQRLYVTLWGRAEVAVIDLKSNRISALWKTQEHPCEMALTRSGKFLFVANANQNTVTVFDTDAGKSIETIWAALYPHSPPGSTPNSLALSPDEETLFVANACNNVVAVFDVRRPGRSRSLGFLPAGWYPTCVRVTPDGRRLLVANGKGLTARANPGGPQPGVKPGSETINDYIARLFRGSLSVIELPARDRFVQDLKVFTAQALASSPLRPDASATSKPAQANPVPTKPGDPSPIKYCIYIIKENRTYDQVFGDLPEGRGDPNLCIFPEENTPNHHALAREFGLLDNFYVESEVSADGHEWSMGAYASDFVEKMWPLSYGHNAHGKYLYPSEGTFEIATPAGGYLWDRAREAGVSYRSYGEWVASGKTPADPGRAKARSLEGHIDPWFHPYDLNYPDVKRADRFIAELRRFEREGNMPQLQILRLPNDHTHGVSPGRPTPRAYLADNDHALGMVVEAVSTSKFWPQTAIFVVEDDAQNGPDHVDAHRTVAFAISPWSRKGSVVSEMYSTASMLRTIELILGLKPMSQFDAAARPMYACFAGPLDPRPFKALPPRIDVNEKNPRLAWGSEFKMDFSKEDAADDLLLNEVVWRSVRGANSPMPPPVRAGFVLPAGDGDEDD